MSVFTYVATMHIFKLTYLLLRKAELVGEPRGVQVPYSPLK